MPPILTNLKPKKGRHFSRLASNFVDIVSLINVSACGARVSPSSNDQFEEQPIHLANILTKLFFAVINISTTEILWENNSFSKGRLQLICLANTQGSRPLCFSWTEFGWKSWAAANNYLLEAPPAICPALIPAGAGVASYPLLFSLSQDPTHFAWSDHKYYF